MWWSRLASPDEVDSGKNLKNGVDKPRLMVFNNGMSSHQDTNPNTFTGRDAEWAEQWFNRLAWVADDHKHFWLMVVEAAKRGEEYKPGFAAAWLGWVRDHCQAM